MACHQIHYASPAEARTQLAAGGVCSASWTSRSAFKKAYRFPPLQRRAEYRVGNATHAPFCYSRTWSGDAAVMFDYRNNERCSRYQRGQTKDYAQIAELVERRAHDTLSAEAPCMLAVARKETNEMIGEIVVVPKDNTIAAPQCPLLPGRNAEKSLSGRAGTSRRRGYRRFPCSRA